MMKMMQQTNILTFDVRYINFHYALTRLNGIYPEDPMHIRRKATTSLATYDLNLLRVWYEALLRLNSK